MTSVSVTNGGAGYTTPTVSFTGGANAPVDVTVGNPLVDRAYATDYSTPPTIVQPTATVDTVDPAVYDIALGTAIGGTFDLGVDGTVVTVPFEATRWRPRGALGGPAVATVSGTWHIVFTAAPSVVTVDGTNLVQPTAPLLVPVLVVVPTPLPAGTLNAFQARNQATPGGSPAPSAGNDFHAYVLRKSGTDYSVVFDSGLLTVPALADPAISEIGTFPIAGGVAVQAGDVLGFYGAGIPVDIDAAGLDILSYPAPAAPVQGATITLPSAAFPIYPQARTYSFGALVTDTSGVGTPTAATATVFGGVDAVVLTDFGSGYTMPTVDFDFPDDPAGTQATAHVTCAATTGPDVACSDPGVATPLVITGVVVDNPGSGYAAAPSVVIRDGTAFDPLLGSTPAPRDRDPGHPVRRPRHVRRRLPDRPDRGHHRCHGLRLRRDRNRDHRHRHRLRV